MRIDIYIHDFLDGHAAPKHSCEGEFEHAVLNRLERIMADLAQLNALLVTIGDEVGKVSADTDNLLAQLQAIPPGGLTPEQQAAIDTAVASAQGIAQRLQAIDQKVPDAPAPGA